MSYKVVLLVTMLVCFVNYSATHSEDGLYDDDRTASALTFLQPHSGSEDFVLNERKMLEKGHQFPLWMDVQALLSFKKDINDPSGKLSNWTTENSKKVCSWWYGITCSKHNPRVVAIILPGLSLTGTLSPFIGNLSFLHTLNLSHHNLTGEIPLEFGHLKALRVLDLSQSTPQSLIFNSTFGYFSESLSFNYMLTGSIPKSLSNCTSLERIALRSNNFTGSIPTEFGHLVKLELLDLSSNSLSGHIPPTLSNCTKLSTLYLFSNKFTGTIPTEFGRLVDLKQLLLTMNSLSGHIPPTLSNCTKLLVLSLTSNNFKGTIPTEFGHLIDLELLDLGYTLLGGRIPPTLGNCTKLQYIYLRGNQLSGSIHETIHKCNSLEVLDVSENLLSGHLVIKFPVSMKMFSAHTNSFSGPLPPSLANCSALQVLELRENRFTGELPSYITSLYNLQVLSLGYNKFYGGITQWITNLTKLEILELSNNKFSGMIPCGPERLQGFAINESRRDEPYIEITIDVNGGEYSLAYLFSHTIFDLSSNDLTGEIPASIGRMSALVYLNLSRNRLEGKIPSFLGTISTLKELDLANNNLSGEIPQELSKLSMLVVLDLSSNRLCGPIPRGTLFSTFNVTSFQRNKCLCGYPFQACKEHKTRSVGRVTEERNFKVGILSHVDENMSLIALGIGALIGFWGVVVLFIVWERARDWVVPPNRPKHFYGEYRLPT